MTLDWVPLDVSPGVVEQSSYRNNRLHAIPGGKLLLTEQNTLVTVTKYGIDRLTVVAEKNKNLEFHDVSPRGNMAVGLIRVQTPDCTCITELVLLNTTEKKVKRIAINEFLRLGVTDTNDNVNNVNTVTTLGFSPDGRYLIFAVRSEDYQYFAFDNQLNRAFSFGTPNGALGYITPLMAINKSFCRWVHSKKLVCLEKEGLRVIRIDEGKAATFVSQGSWGRSGREEWELNAATISPDGTGILAVLREKSQSNWRVWLYSFDANIEKTIYEGQQQIMWPTFSFDGRFIAFMVMGGEKDGNRVLIIDRSGELIGEGTADKYSPVRFSWSPTENRLAYVLSRTGPPQDEPYTLEVISFPDWEPKLLYRRFAPDGPWVGIPFYGIIWSPDGKSILPLSYSVWRFFDDEKLIKSIDVDVTGLPLPSWWIE